MAEDQDKLAEEWAKALAQEEEGGAAPDKLPREPEVKLKEF